MLSDQRHLFDIPDHVAYLNVAYMSPLLHTVAQAGVTAVNQKKRPYEIVADDFFTPVTNLKRLYAQLIDCDEPERICMIPSVSHGISTVINNLDLSADDEIVVLEEQFPSNMYAWQRLAAQTGATLKVITNPGRAQDWNQHLLDQINERTAVVSMCHTHWADGTKFDLKAVRARTNEVDAMLIIDGTQSVGALPFSVRDIQPDALICAAYKWLLGPYASGLAYFGPKFDHGIPIEENWSNRLDSENFSGLTAYEERYKPFANRYNVGEQANFIAVPMLTEAIKQLLDWTPEAIQQYCEHTIGDRLDPLLDMGCQLASPANRGQHLFGIKLPDSLNLKDLQTALAKEHIFVSIRGQNLRISVHVFNTASEVERLVSCILNQN